MPTGHTLEFIEGELVAVLDRGMRAGQRDSLETLMQMGDVVFLGAEPVGEDDVALALLVRDDGACWEHRILVGPGGSLKVAQ